MICCVMKTRKFVFKMMNCLQAVSSELIPPAAELSPPRTYAEMAAFLDLDLDLREGCARARTVFLKIS